MIMGKLGRMINPVWKTEDIPFMNVPRIKNYNRYEALRIFLHLHANAGGFTPESLDKNQNNAEVDIDVCLNQKYLGILLNRTLSCTI